MQVFQADQYYAWFYEGSQVMTYVGAVAMLLVMLAGVMFPLWPPIMRLGVWYISIGVLGLIGLFFAIAIVRLIFYIITVIVASPGIWIFPKLFADVGFVSGVLSSLCQTLPDFVDPGRVLHTAVGVGPAEEEKRQEGRKVEQV